MGSFFNSFKAGKFLLGFLSSDPVAFTPHNVRESGESTDAGTRFDLYEPLSQPMKTVITVHGMTLNGSRDSRLVHFSRYLAHHGIRVAAVELPGLKSCRFDGRDIEAMVDLVNSLAAAHGSPVGIIAFSFGAGMAMTAAADDSIGDNIDFIVSFGACGSLEEFCESVRKQQKRTQTTQKELDDFIYTNAVMAFHVMDQLDFDGNEREELTRFLVSYCNESSMDAKISYQENVLQKLDVIDVYERTLDHELLRAISPSGKMHKLGCKVLLLHDSDDQLIPPDHSRKLFEELTSGGNRKGHRLLVTSVLSHVNPGNLLRVNQMLTLVKMMGEIFIENPERG
ncbi:MAG: alpha/beta fold hydrolase [Pseudomonadota bacterium]